MTVQALMMRRAEVLQYVGISHQTLYELMRREEFPRSVKIGPGSVRWRKDQIDKWLESRPTTGAA